MFSAGCLRKAFKRRAAAARLVEIRRTKFLNFKSDCFIFLFSSIFNAQKNGKKEQKNLTRWIFDENLISVLYL
jgi:hypothetical protein